MINYNVFLTFAIRITDGIATGIWASSVLSTYINVLEGDNAGANEKVGIAQAIQGTFLAAAAIPAGWLASRYKRSSILRVMGFVAYAAIACTAAALMLDEASEPYGKYKFQLLCGGMALWGVAQANAPVLDALFADSVPTGARSYLYTRLHVGYIVSQGVGPAIAAGVFYMSEDKWCLAVLQTVMLIGMVAAIVPATLLLLLDDSKALGQESEGVLALLRSGKRRGGGGSSYSSPARRGGAGGPHAAGGAGGRAVSGLDDEDDYRRPLLQDLNEEEVRAYQTNTIGLSPARPVVLVVAQPGTPSGNHASPTAASGAHQPSAPSTPIPVNGDDVIASHALAMSVTSSTDYASTYRSYATSPFAGEAASAATPPRNGSAAAGAGMASNQQGQGQGGSSALASKFRSMQRAIDSAAQPGRSPSSGPASPSDQGATGARLMMLGNVDNGEVYHPPHHELSMRAMMDKDSVLSAHTSADGGPESGSGEGVGSPAGSAGSVDLAAGLNTRRPATTVAVSPGGTMTTTITTTSPLREEKPTPRLVGARPYHMMGSGHLGSDAASALATIPDGEQPDYDGLEGAADGAAGKDGAAGEVAVIIGGKGEGAAGAGAPQRAALGAERVNEYLHNGNGHGHGPGGGVGGQGGHSDGHSDAGESVSVAEREAHKLAGRRWGCLRVSSIPIILAITDCTMGLASGMTIKFFPIFFKDEVRLPPSSVMYMYCVIPIALSLAAIMAQRMSRSIGRVQTMVLNRGIGICLLYFIALHAEMWQRGALMVVVYVCRTSIMNSIYPLQKSIMMDFVAKRQRSLWNSLEAITAFGWSGSAALGGWLIHVYGFETTFLITATTQAVGWALSMLLLPIVPVHEDGLTRLAASSPTRTAGGHGHHGSNTGSPRESREDYTP